MEVMGLYDNLANGSVGPQALHEGPIEARRRSIVNFLYATLLL